VRPFGISCFLAGFQDGRPHIYLTEPSGAYAEWKAHAVGKKSKELREFLEEAYEDGMNEARTVELAVRTLLEVVESEKQMEICVVRAKDAETLAMDDVAKIVARVKQEKEEAEAAKDVLHPTHSRAPPRGWPAQRGARAPPHGNRGPMRVFCFHAKPKLGAKPIARDRHDDLGNARPAATSC